MIFISFLGLISLFSNTNASAYWGYEHSSYIDQELDPADWYKQYPQCAGLHQSPINIDHNSSVYDDQLMKITFDYENKLTNFDDYNNMIWSRVNNGHTIVLSLENGEIGTVFEHERKYTCQCV